MSKKHNKSILVHKGAFGLNTLGVCFSFRIWFSLETHKFTLEFVAYVNVRSFTSTFWHKLHPWTWVFISVTHVSHKSCVCFWVRLCGQTLGLRMTL